MQVGLIVWRRLSFSLITLFGVIPEPTRPNTTTADEEEVDDDEEEEASTEVESLKTLTSRSSPGLVH